MADGTETTPSGRHPIRPLTAAVLGVFIAGLYLFTPMLLADERPRGARLALTVALAILAAAGTVALMFVPRVLERRGSRPRLLMFLRGSMGVVPFVGMMGVHAAATGSALAGLQLFGHMIPMFVGMGIVGAGAAKRAGRTRHCPRCDYEFGFASEADAPIRCPECGTGWLGRLVTGRRVRSPALIVTGVVVAVAPIVLMFSGPGAGVAQRLPTPVLLAWVSAARFSNAPMEELAARTLTADQTADLAGRLLDRRRTAPFSLGVAARNWLDAAVTAGSLPAPLKERFFAEMFRGRLAAPMRVRAGEPFRVALRDTRAEDGFAVRCYVYIAGFGVGGGEAAAGRSTEGYYPILIDSARADRTGLRGEVPGATLTIDEPGVHRVRAELWIVVQSGFPGSVAWTADGLPESLPPGSLWWKKVVLEREVEVTP